MSVKKGDFDSNKTWGYKVLREQIDYCMDCEEYRIKQYALDNDGNKVKVCTTCNKTYYSNWG